MKRLSKKLQLSAVVTLGPVLLKGIQKSIKWTNLGAAGESAYWEDKHPLIGAFWHDQQLLMSWLFLDFKGSSDAKPHVLISAHHDGRLIAGAIEKLGMKTIAGSSTRGGEKALFQMASVLRNGDSIAITPDGPKGPRHKVKNGVIKLAQLTGAPIYTAAIATENPWIFSSWDRMTLPKPFSRGVRYISEETIRVPSKISKVEFEEIRIRVENSLNNATKIVEDYFKQ